MENQFIKGGIYVFENDVKKEVYVGQTINFETRKHNHENGSHREELYNFIIDFDTKYKEVYEFYNLTHEDKNDLSILENCICKKYEDIGYELLNRAQIYTDFRRRLSKKFCNIVGGKDFVVINDKDIQNIRVTIDELRRYIVNEIIIYGGIIRKSDVKNIKDIISKSEYLYHWWKESIRYSESFKNRDFREIFWDIGIDIEDKYDYIKETWNFIVTGFSQRMGRYNNDDAFIANILNSDRVKKNYCNIVYNTKAIYINWYIENKGMFT
ncbi:GIY-YIG nuclease family protein [Terrisporobacter petrolearius]|uniref:GIY-YIG nuclease family protein n=1 Tax=Terrisporobacter petrolearius TaxID=1460447 RepID=UPI0022E8C1CA|nr:GIY-YIG nuclease family protein [Terrisporobacter petrolearius]